MAAKKAAKNRVRMSEADVEKYLKHYSKAHDLKGKEFEHAVHRCAATRWAALERNAAKVGRKTKPRSAKSSKRK